MKAQRFEVWTAYNPRTQMQVYRLIDAEEVQEAPGVDWFEAYMDKVERLGVVEITVVEGGAKITLGRAYIEEM